MRTAGLLLDFYDDPAQGILKTAFPTLEDVPALVKTAHFLTPEQRDVLRDEGYALILQNEGQTLRKFACVDEGNTLLSALYLEKNHEKLPAPAVKVAAANILAACGQFGIEPTPFLKEAAKTGMSRKRDPMLQPYVGDEADWAGRTNLTTSQVAQPGSMVLDTAMNMKTSAARRVDVSGLEPEVRMPVKTAARRTLDRYPLDAFADVEAAVRYFEERYVDLDPADRHEYAVKTASRADELGIQTSELLDRYGSTEYAPDVDAHLANRRALVDDAATKALYTDLQEKRAAFEPLEFAQTLGEIDRIAGLDWHYGGHLADPYFATFGGRGVEKTASWSWQDGMGTYVTEAQILNLARNHRPTLHKNFSEDLVDGFQKDPIKIFESLPATTKTLLARMANDAGNPVG